MEKFRGKGYSIRKPLFLDREIFLVIMVSVLYCFSLLYFCMHFNHLVVIAINIVYLLDALYSKRNKIFLK